MKVLSSLAALIGIALLLPTSALAGKVTFGSDMVGPATLEDNHQADTLFFNAPGQPNSLSSPVDGEVVAVRVMGTILPRKRPGAPPVTEIERLWHIQTIRPEANGSYTVTTSSNHLYFPVSVPDDTVTTFRASHPQCVNAGDVVNFNNVGGWTEEAKQAGDPDGTRYKIFKRAPGLNVNWYEKDAGTMLGDNFLVNRQVQNGAVVDPNREHPVAGQATPAGTPYEGRELLMQVDVATGYDAAVNCPGGRAGREYKGVSVSTPNPVALVREDGLARVRVNCIDGTHLHCEGSLRLDGEGGTFGTSASFKLGENATTNVQVPLTPAAARLLATRGKLDVNATAITRDGYGVERTDVGPVTLTSASPPTPTGFLGTMAKAQSVTYKKGRKLTMKAMCPLSTQGTCTGTVSALSRVKIGKRRIVLAKGKYTIAPGKTARFPIKLTSAGLKGLKKRKKVDTTATLSSKDGAGKKATAKAKVTFKYSR